MKDQYSSSNSAGIYYFYFVGNLLFLQTWHCSKGYTSTDIGENKFEYFDFLISPPAPEAFPWTNNASRYFSLSDYRENILRGSGRC